MVRLPSFPLVVLCLLISFPASAASHVSTGAVKLPSVANASPFTFAAPVVTVTGVTPGAMTFWLSAAATGDDNVAFVAKIANDTDLDGSVSVSVPVLAPYGVWVVADLNAHTLVFDNPSHNAHSPSPFPLKAFLRDSNGHYTHIQFPATIYSISMFTWARPGVGAWMLLAKDASPIDDEDGAQNGSITFETSAMNQTSGTTVPPPADGLQPGDMFLAVGNAGTVWWGDVVDSHLPESNGPGKLGFPSTGRGARENAGSAKVVIERTEGTDGSVSAQYATADDTLVAGRNYVAQAGTVTFGAGEILKTISIPLIDDQVYSGYAQFKVNLSNPSGASLGIVTANVVVLDDEQAPVLSVQFPSPSVQEGDVGKVDIPITVKLTGATYLPMTVNCSWHESSGLAGELAFQFAPGETEKTFTASYDANTIPQPDRTINVRLWNEKNATAPRTDATLTIVDDDFAGVSVADASVLENAGSVIVPLQLSRTSLKPVTVTYETRNLSAVSGSDYVATSGTMTVSSGLSITIPILDDTIPETLEAFEVVLKSVNGGKLDRSTATVTIVDDDATPGLPALRLSPLSTAYFEGDSGTHNFPVNVTMTGSSQQAVSVSYSWTEIPGTGTPHTGTLQFLPGEAQKSFNVSFIGNTIPEPDRKIDITLSNATGATIAVGNATITIFDDDLASFSIEDVTVMENAGVASVPFVLSEVSLKPVTIGYQTLAGSALDGVDFIATNGEITFQPGTTRMTVDIPLVNDAVAEPSKIFTVVFTGIIKNGAGPVPGHSVGTVTILDDDSALPTRHRSVRH